MEDDDDFGDLYADVLTPFTTSSVHQTAPVQTVATSFSRPIDLNNVQRDDGKVLFKAPDYSQKTLGVDLNNSFSRRDSNQQVIENGSFAAGRITLDQSKSTSRVLESGGEVKLPDSQKRGFEDPNLINESEIDVIVEEADDKDENLLGRGVNFDVEEGITGIGDSMIPGLSIPGVSDVANNSKDADFGEGDDWDSDSEDDLQIVLNDNNHGPLAMDHGEGPDDEDEDGDPLVIVADNDPNHQLIQEQDWGEDAAASAGGDGDRKELGDGSTKMVTPQKTAYGYHNQFHSQFKYVRPGAAPIPGAAPPVAPGGTVGQIRPPVNVGPTSGRGRGDWRSSGMKPFNAGYGVPVWGNNNAPGQGFGRGLDFTLPSHKTIFEVDIDSFEEKPWRLPGIDISDFFNFGLTEETWKGYCKQLEQLRLEGTMQSKIRVYESGRAEQEYDPDMPPELAAAAGNHDVLPENANLGKPDAGQIDLERGSIRARPQLPTGRPIQVETGYGERQPSIDTRPPRIRDSDAIIEIVLKDSGDDDSSHENDIAELPDNGTSRDILREHHDVEEDNAQEDTALLGEPEAYHNRKREIAGRKASSNSSGSDASEQSPVYSGRSFCVLWDERRTKGRVHDRSSSMNRSGSTQDKRDESVESIDGKRSADFDHKAAMDEVLVQADGSSEIDGEEIGLHKVTTRDTLKDENHSIENPSKVKQPFSEKFDDGGDSKAAKSSNNSSARSRSKSQVERPDMDGQKGREDSYNCKNMKTEISDRRKESDNSKDADLHGRRSRTGDMRRSHRGDEMGSKHRSNKAREMNRSDIDEYQLRKQVDNGGWRGHHDKDLVKTRIENSDDLRSKRRKEDTHLKRDRGEKEELVHAYRENTIRRKRERDDITRLRHDDQHSVRHKEEGWSQRERERERDEWQRELKRRDRVEKESVLRHRGSEDIIYSRGNQLNNDDRRSRQQSASTRSDRVIIPEKNHKEKSTRKSKELSEGDHYSRRNQEDHGSQISERVTLRGTIEQGSGEPVNRQSSKKHKELASFNSDDEQQQQDSKRGRSKLERWTSQKDRDFNAGVIKSSSSSSLANKIVPETDYSSTANERDDGGDQLMTNKNAQVQQPMEDRHLDTVAKLRKRSERFNLPLPIGKEAVSIKKMENELLPPLPPVQAETRPNSEIKLERPARKRRWTSNN